MMSSNFSLCLIAFLATLVLVLPSSWAERFEISSFEDSRSCEDFVSHFETPEIHACTNDLLEEIQLQKNRPITKKSAPSEFDRLFGLELLVSVGKGILSRNHTHPFQ